MDTVASRMSSPMDVTDLMDLNEIWKSSWMLVFFRFSCLEQWVNDRCFWMFFSLSRHRICSPLTIVNSTFIDVKNRRAAWWCGKKCSSRTVSLWKRHSGDRASCTSPTLTEAERERERCFVLLGKSLVISIFMISRNSVDAFVNRWNNI